MNAYADNCRIETRFVWARCAAGKARAMRDLIRAFQEDGWGAEEAEPRRKPSRRAARR
jgi:hypothetical protein